MAQVEVISDLQTADEMHEHALVIVQTTDKMQIVVKNNPCLQSIASWRR